MAKATYLDVAKIVTAVLIDHKLDFVASADHAKGTYEFRVKPVAPDVTEELRIDASGEVSVYWDLGYMFDCFALKDEEFLLEIPIQLNAFFSGRAVYHAYLKDGRVSSGGPILIEALSSIQDENVVFRSWHHGTQSP